MTGFRPCSTCTSRSQAPIYQCAQEAGFHSARGDLCAPPLLFGRRPPQSNCPPAAFPSPDDGRGLGARRAKGGISTATPRPPGGTAQSLPPILRMKHPDPTAGCSKAPRGLFVLSRVDGIFTVSSISPGPSLRQRPDRYAIRAGRNLPDKEFRYLRTVIVTAAIDRGFGSRLSPLPLTFRHRAGVSPYTSAHALAGTCVFVKQSPGPAHCGPPRLFTPQRASLLPKLRDYFAEFLNEGSPVHLGVLTPAHLCRFAVRAPHSIPPRAFLGPGDRPDRLASRRGCPTPRPPKGTACLEAATPTPPPAYPTASPWGTLSSRSGNGI